MILPRRDARQRAAILLRRRQGRIVADNSLIVTIIVNTTITITIVMIIIGILYSRRAQTCDCRFIYNCYHCGTMLLAKIIFAFA